MCCCWFAVRLVVGCRLVVRLVGWLIGWLVNCFVGCFCLLGWLVGLLVSFKFILRAQCRHGWLLNWVVCLLAVWLVVGCWLVGCLLFICWLVGCLLVAWLGSLFVVGYLLAGWLVIGWLQLAPVGWIMGNHGTSCRIMESHGNLFGWLFGLPSGCCIMQPTNQSHQPTNQTKSS